MTALASRRSCIVLFLFHLFFVHECLSAVSLNGNDVDVDVDVDVVVESAIWQQNIQQQQPNLRRKNGAVTESTTSSNSDTVSDEDALPLTNRVRGSTSVNRHPTSYRTTSTSIGRSSRSRSNSRKTQRRSRSSSTKSGSRMMNNPMTINTKRSSVSSRTAKNDEKSTRFSSTTTLTATKKQRKRRKLQIGQLITKNQNDEEDGRLGFGFFGNKNNGSASGSGSGSMNGSMNGSGSGSMSGSGSGSGSAADDDECGTGSGSASGRAGFFGKKKKKKKTKKKKKDEKNGNDTMSKSKSKSKSKGKGKGKGMNGRSGSGKRACNRGRNRGITTRVGDYVVELDEKLDTYFYSMSRKDNQKLQWPHHKPMISPPPPGRRA